MEEAAREGEGPGEEEWSEARFLALAMNGHAESAYRLLLPALTKLRGHLTARYLCELGGAPGVEEIVHEAAWKSVEMVRSYSPERGGVLYWAWKLGVNHAQDRIRSELSRKKRERSAAKPNIVRPPSDEARAVREAIDRLAEPFRSVLTFDLENGGLGPATVIAPVLKVEVQTVYNLRYQARRMLADLLR